MKNIYEFHVREVHIADMKLKLKVCNIDQAIEALELALIGASQVSPDFCEVSFQLSNKPTESKSRHFDRPIVMVEVMYLCKQKEEYNDMCFINMLSGPFAVEKVFFKAQDIPNVKARLQKLITRFKNEREKVLGRDDLPWNTETNTLDLTPPAGEKELDIYGVRKLVGEPMENRDGSFYVSSSVERQTNLVLTQIRKADKPEKEPKQKDFFKPAIATIYKNPVPKG